MMNKMYYSVMEMEKLMNAYEGLIDDLSGFLKDNGIDIAGDPSEHPALMLYSEAGKSTAGCSGPVNWRTCSVWKVNIA